MADQNRRRLGRAVTAAGVAVAGVALSSTLLVSAQPLPQPIVGKPGLLLQNGAFDAGNRSGHPIGWGVEGNAEGANIVNLGAYRTAGLGSLEINDVAGSAVSVRSERIVATAGDDYTLTANVKGRSGTPAWLYLEFWDFDRNRIGATNAEPAFSTDWQTVTVTGVAPPNTAHVTAHVYGSQAAAGISYWDEVVLSAAPPAYDPHLGAERELFLDDYRIESAHDVERVVHPGEKLQRPVLRPDQPWEDSAYTYGSVYVIDGLYRMWYTCYNDQAPHYHLCYAESADGITWDKPLGRSTVSGVGYKDIPASQTNIVMAGSGAHVAYNPDAPADRKYFLMKSQPAPGVPGGNGYYGWKSPDGYNWTPLSSTHLLNDGDVVQTTWDPRAELYIATIKKRMFTSRTPGIYERSAFVSTSPDLVTWTTPQLAVMGDSADDGAAEAIGGLEAQIYGMPVHPYESTYVGVPWVFLTTDYTSGEYATAADGPVLPQLATSRDLLRWERPVRDPLLEPSRGGAWDDGALYTASNILVDDEKITMYYAGFQNGHGGADADDPNRDRHFGNVGLATWRRDGFASMTNASLPGLGDPGEITTKPVVFDGASLNVNAVVHEGGSLQVEVLTADGEPIPGFTAADVLPINGDRLSAPVNWRGRARLANLAGQQVKFRFHLVNTDLYSYWVGQG
ncbi:glycoside hydrolase family protein [Jiangella alkaliphila]|uniref:Carbohydrate binding domain-containing protein n=1 Tax=Jiangella alkaliphila TaxID=419479 RepID=A0A1H2JRZ0_9ACTN|nr:hypothetical protein [Jiangella alkaliphila]SDU59157.1 hypothetical protein SAMN04488563_3010 [Jiangella alkaliphila]